MLGQRENLDLCRTRFGDPDFIGRGDIADVVGFRSQLCFGENRLRDRIDHVEGFLIAVSREDCAAPEVRRRNSFAVASGKVRLRGESIDLVNFLRARINQKELAGTSRRNNCLLYTSCAPNLPMFFMGQEYGASTIFTYFTDFQDRDLAKAVSEGRKKEYEGFLDEGFIDPQSQEAFDSSKLDWREVEEPQHQELLKFHRDLLALRRHHKSLSNCRKDLTSVEFNQTERWITIERRDDCGERAIIVCNLDVYKRQQLWLRSAH